MPDLTLPPPARRRNNWLAVLGIAGLGMVLIVLADDNHWGLFGVVAIVFSFSLWSIGTAAYRLRQRGPRTVQVHSMLGLSEVDLSNGYSVKGSKLRPRTVVLRVGRKRFRVLKNVGGSAGSIDSWLQEVAAA